MSLNLLDQYGSSGSESDTPTNKDTPTINKLPSTIDGNTKIDNADSKGRSYFEENFSDEDSTGPDGSGMSSESDSPVPVDSLLPLPDLQRIHSGKVEASCGSVFSNPYLEEEEAKLAVLKQHVSLAPTEEPVRERKRRFVRGRGQRRGVGGARTEGELFDDRDSSIKRKEFKKVRAGVGESLVPSNKYMKLHYKQQASERPWTIQGKPPP